MVGGIVAGAYTNSVLALLPRATSWKALTSLPKTLGWVGSSMVNGKLWVTGGYAGGNTYNSYVSVSIHFMSRYSLLISLGF